MELPENMVREQGETMSPEDTHLLASQYMRLGIHTMQPVQNGSTDAEGRGRRAKEQLLLGDPRLLALQNALATL